MQRGLAPRQPALGVTELTRYITRVLGNDSALKDVWVRGEVSSGNQGVSGHWYFTLKDEGAQVPCVLWRSNIHARLVMPQPGRQVLVRGRLTVYAPQGRYQLDVQDIRLDGQGERQAALDQLRERLSREGLLSPVRKRPLPAFPSRVVVVTSIAGAALRDMIRFLRMGPFPPAVTIIDTPVQGETAEAWILQALQTANRIPGGDVVILGRGGGAAEDLWTFNSEAIVRAVAASRLPVISAVGHESDRTLTDEVADVRAATPTAAAQLIADARGRMIQREAHAMRQVRTFAGNRLAAERARLRYLNQAQPLARPVWMLDLRRRRLDEALERLDATSGRLLDTHRRTLAALAGQLEAVSPLATLARGYCVATRPGTDRTVRRASELAVGQEVSIRLLDGTAGCRVLEIQGDE